MVDRGLGASQVLKVVVELDQVLPFDIGKAYLPPELGDPVEPVLLDLPSLDPLDALLELYELLGGILEGDLLGLPWRFDPVILRPPLLVFLLPQKLRPGGILGLERDPDPLPVRREAYVLIKEK